MLEIQPRKVRFQFACRALRDESMASVAIMPNRLAIGAGVMTVMTAVAAREIQMPNIVRINPPIYVHAGKETLGVNMLCFRDGLCDQARLGIGKCRILGPVECR